MVQDSTTYYVWIGGSCDYGHKEPTHEARAETKLVWSLLSFARYFGIIQINLASALAVPSFQILNGLYFVCFAATKIQNFSRFLLYFAIFFILNSSFYHIPSKDGKLQ